MKTISFDVNVPSNVTITIPKEGEKLNIGVNVEEKEIQEWKTFKKGDVLSAISGTVVIFDKYDSYDKEIFSSICHAFCKFEENEERWDSRKFVRASESSKAKFLNYLRDEKGLEWDEEKKELRKIFKEGDFVVLDNEWVSIYKGEGYYDDTISDYCGCYLDEHVLDIHSVKSRVFNISIKHATAAQKQVLLNYLKRNGREWTGKKLVEVPKKGDFVIAWDISYWHAKIDVFDHYEPGKEFPYYTSNSSYINAVKWDGTKEHFERVLRGEFY